MTATLTLLGLAALQLATPAAPPAPTVAGRYVVAWAPRAAARLDIEAPPAWLAQDPADSTYRAARTALNEGNYRRAADLFGRLRERYPRSGYVAASMYYQALALQRIGGMDQLREARALLREQLERFPDDARNRQARELEVSVNSDLARMGDPEAAADVARAARAAAPAPAVPVSPPTRVVAPTPRTPPVPRAPRVRSGRDDCDDDTEAMIALQALMNMRPEQALPILRQVMERRDDGSVCLRRRATFILAQQRSPEVTALLLQAARSDPDNEVREQGVFWLSQVNAPEAVAALDSILRQATDRELQDKAIFALSQQRAPAAAVALRRYLERSDTPIELREQVIFWLGQRNDDESTAYLRQYFNRTSEPQLRERILFSVAQRRSEENADWLVQVAMDENQSSEIRKTAIFWASQMRSFPIADLQTLYGRVTEREIKEQIIFALSQRREDAAIDAMIAIARQERDPELRRSVIFWLGQSNNPRAAEFLLELINQ